MKKLFAMLLVLLLAVSVSAQAPFVMDSSGLLSAAEVKSLEAELSQIYQDHGLVVSVVTADTFGQLTAAQYAANCYETYEYPNDGVLLLVSETEGQWYIYTSGMAAKQISDSDAAQLGELLKNDLQAGNYLDAFQTFAEKSTAPVSEALAALAEDAEVTRSAQSKFVVWGMAGGLVVGLALSVLLYFKANPTKPAKEKRQREPETQTQET